MNIPFGAYVIYTKNDTQAKKLANTFNESNNQNIGKAIAYEQSESYPYSPVLFLDPFEARIQNSFEQAGQGSKEVINDFFKYNAPSHHLRRD